MAHRRRVHHSPFRRGILRGAREYEAGMGFLPPDAIIYAAALYHAASETDVDKVFVNRNSKDFTDPNVYDDLPRHPCRMPSAP